MESPKRIIWSMNKNAFKEGFKKVVWQDQGVADVLQCYPERKMRSRSCQTLPSRHHPFTSMSLNRPPLSGMWTT